MLSALAIQNARPRDSLYRLSDGNGLSLQVERTGSKLWRFRYRFGGKAKMLSLGSIPEVSLATAREKRDAARKLLAEGIDPSQQKKLDKFAATVAAGNTFRAVASDYLEKLEAEGRSPSTLKKNRWPGSAVGKAADRRNQAFRNPDPAEANRSCGSAWGLDADWHRNSLIFLQLTGSNFGAYSRSAAR